MSTQIVNKFIMFSIAVSDMKKAKEFYAEKLGLEVVTDYRQSDDNWWVTLTPPGGGASITLARTSSVKTMTKFGRAGSCAPETMPSLRVKARKTPVSV